MVAFDVKIRTNKDEINSINIIFIIIIMNINNVEVEVTNFLTWYSWIY